MFGFFLILKKKKFVDHLQDFTDHEKSTHGNGTLLLKGSAFVYKKFSKIFLIVLMVVKN